MWCRRRCRRGGGRGGFEDGPTSGGDGTPSGARTRRCLLPLVCPALTEQGDQNRAQFPLKRSFRSCPWQTSRGYDAHAMRAPALRAPLPHISPSRTPGAPASLNGLRPKVPPAATTLLRLAAQPIDAPRSLRGRRVLRELRRLLALNGAHCGENGPAKWAIKRFAEPAWLPSSNGPEGRTARSRGDIAGAAYVLRSWSAVIAPLGRAEGAGSLPLWLARDQGHNGTAQRARERLAGFVRATAGHRLGFRSRKEE
jgi:hypothetical protein